MIRFFTLRKIPKPAIVGLLISILFVVLVIAVNYREPEVIKLRQFASTLRTVNSSKLSYSMRQVYTNPDISFSCAEINNKAYSGRMVHLDSNGTTLSEVKFFEGYKYGAETHYYSDGSISKVLYYPERFYDYYYQTGRCFNPGNIICRKFSKDSRVKTLEAHYYRNEKVLSFKYQGSQNSNIVGDWNDEGNQFNLRVNSYNNQVINLYYDRMTDAFKFRNQELSGSNVNIITFPSGIILPIEQSGLQSKVSNWEILWKLLESDEQQRISYTKHILQEDATPIDDHFLLEEAQNQGTLILEKDGFAAYNVAGKIYTYKDGILIAIDRQVIAENIAN